MLSVQKEYPVSRAGHISPKEKEGGIVFRYFL